MANLSVKPSYQFTETDIITVDKLNLLGTPVVTLLLETPVTDQNYFRNGNFYSSFWATPTGVPVPPTSWVQNADFWLCQSTAGTPTYQRSANVPDLFSLFSAQLVGAVGVSVVNFGSQISGDLSATLRRPCTFSGYIENNTGAVLNPQLLFYTCNAFNNFAAVTLQATINLQTGANAQWTYVTATEDVSTLANAGNGLLIAVSIPAGALAATSQTVNFSRLKFQIGELATEFSDDPSLFVTSPSIDSTMLQDGCIARPTLFAPNVIPSGAFVAGAIHGADIAAATIAGANLTATAVADSLGYTPIDKDGDSGVGVIGFTQDTVVSSSGQPGIVISTTAPNATNNGYDPALGFSRPDPTTPVWRYIGLAPTRRFRTVDDTNNVGYLLDTITGVDAASYQAGSITLAALAQSLIDIVIPPGMIRMFGGPSIPTGWLVCDGSAVSRTGATAALFAALGTYWGAGDNISTFNLPDLRGRSPLGYVSSPVSGMTGRAFGSLGGEEAHVLTVSELADHNHTLTDPGHPHNTTQTPHQHSYVNPIGGNASVAGAGQYSAVGTSLTSAVNANITINSATTGITLADAGSNYAHNNMQPFAVVYFIIKT